MSKTSSGPREGRLSNYRSSTRLAAFLLTFAASVAVLPDSYAADGRGTITGKVISQSSGLYLSSARIRVEGTSLAAVSETDGSYKLRGVPEGDVVLVVEYGGTSIQKLNVNVSDGETVNQNVGITLRGTNLPGSEDGVFELEPFEVKTQAEFNAAALAINEERFSTELKDVVAADQFGDNTDGNLGEFIKFLPGVNVSYGSTYGSGADATSVGIRGFGAEHTAIMVDGVEISGSDPGSLTRAVALDMISVNNASRIEVTKLPTADMPDGATGGSINLVSRTAFEYPKAQFNWRTYLSLNSDNLGNFFSKTPGPTNESTYKTIPGFDFQYVKPINEKFGITVTGQYSQQYNENHTTKSQWGMDRRGTDEDGHYDNVGNPYLKNIQITDAPRIAERTGFGIKADWRPTEGQSLSFRYDRSDYNGTDSYRRIQVKPGDTPLDWGSNGDGTGYVISKTGKAKADMDISFLDRSGDTNNYYLDYKLDRGPWRINATASSSRSNSALDSTNNGHFSVIELQSSGIAEMYMGNITNGIPGILEITDSDGNPYNLYDISNYKVSNLNEASDGGSTLFVRGGQSQSESIKDTFKLDITRDLDFLSTDNFRLTAKTGVFRRVIEDTKSGLGVNYTYRYTGPVSAFDPSVYADEVYVEQDPGFGFSPMTWVDPYKIYDFYEANPDYFSDTEDLLISGDSVAARNYNQSVQNSKHIKETSDAYYVQFEGKALNNKLSFVTGMRWSEAERSGYGPYQNKDRDYLLYDDGTPFYYETVDAETGEIALSPVSVRDDWQEKYGEDRPDVLQQLVDAGFLSSVDDNNTPIESGTLAYKMREWTKDYAIDESSKTDPTFSFQTAYEITNRLTARVGYAKANGAPDFEGSYGVLQRVTFNYTSDGTPGTVTIGNPAIEPWRSDKFDYQLAYYTDLGGKIKLSYFVDETENYIVYDNYIMENLDDLRAFGLPVTDEYIGWTVTTQRNGEGTSRTTGYEVEINQSLGFLGDFGDKFQVYGSYSTKDTVKTDGASLADSPKDGAGFGVYFNSGRFSARVSATYTGELIQKYTRKNYLPDPTSRSGESVQLYYRYPEVTKVDVNFNYQLNDRYGIFYSARNVTNTQTKKEIFDEDGLLPDWVNMESINDYGFNMQLGLRGSF